MATIRVPSEFKEFLQLLGSEKTKYLLVGGYAVAIHGHPRPTEDLDVWIAVSPENAASVVSALRRFGLTGVPHSYFLTPDRITRIGNKPLRLEILTGIDGVTFDACWKRRIIADLDGLKVNVIDRAGLLANKRAAGRPKDLADVDALTGPRRRSQPRARQRALRRRRPAR